jgi:hypothetical protein
LSDKILSLCFDNSRPIFNRFERAAVCICVFIFCLLNSSVCGYVNAKFIRHRRLHCYCEILGFGWRLVYIFDFLGCCAASVVSLLSTFRDSRLASDSIYTAQHYRRSKICIVISYVSFDFLPIEFIVSKRRMFIYNCMY